MPLALVLVTRLDRVEVGSERRLRVDDHLGAAGKLASNLISAVSLDTYN